MPLKRSSHWGAGESLAFTGEGCDSEIATVEVHASVCKRYASATLRRLVKMLLRWIGIPAAPISRANNLVLDDVKRHYVFCSRSHTENGIPAGWQ